MKNTNLKRVQLTGSFLLMLVFAIVISLTKGKYANKFNLLMSYLYFQSIVFSLYLTLRYRSHSSSVYRSMFTGVLQAIIWFIVFRLSMQILVTVSSASSITGLIKAFENHGISELLKVLSYYLLLIIIFTKVFIDSRHYIFSKKRLKRFNNMYMVFYVLCLILLIYFVINSLYLGDLMYGIFFKKEFMMSAVSRLFKRLILMFGIFAIFVVSLFSVDYSSSKDM